MLVNDILFFILKLILQKVIIKPFDYKKRRVDNNLILVYVA